MSVLAELNGNVGTWSVRPRGHRPGYRRRHRVRRLHPGHARQPESASLTRTYLFLGFALSEALAILGFVVPFIIT